MHKYVISHDKKIDLLTLAKICSVLDCEIEDIMEYMR